MLWELSIVVFTVAFLIFTLFSILYLLQLRRTAKIVEITLNTLNESLPVIVTKIQSIAGDLSDAAQIIKVQIHGLSDAVRKIDEMVDDVVDFERAIRRDIETPIAQTLGTYKALAKGLKAFVAALLSRP